MATDLGPVKATRKEKKGKKWKKGKRKKEKKKNLTVNSNLRLTGFYHRGFNALNNVCGLMLRGFMFKT